MISIFLLLLILQRYEFSSKSQRSTHPRNRRTSCCWYYKGTNFQANHNNAWNWCTRLWVVADTTKVRIFKQITTYARISFSRWCCCWYYKGTNFQANHNAPFGNVVQHAVVADTTKVRIFKQITTKMMRFLRRISCCWYYKGTNFQANHNITSRQSLLPFVVADTTKVRIFKQITTCSGKL